MESLEHNVANFHQQADVCLPGSIFHLVLSRCANQSHDFTNLVFVMSSFLFSVIPAPTTLLSQVFCFMATLKTSTDAQYGGILC